MAKKASLDTNAILRLVLNDVPKQFEQVRDMLHDDYIFDISDLSISEVVYVLEGPGYRFSRPDIATTINRIMSDENFNCNRSLFSKVLPFYSIHPALSFVDCCGIFYAEINGTSPLYTFDKKLANQSGGLAKLIT